MGERTDGRIAELINAAVFAGVYGRLARELPDAARGLGRMRAKWSARVAALATEISAGAGRNAEAPAILPTRWQR